MNRVYRFDPDPHNTHALLLAEVPEGARVLEIGTASGYMGEYLMHEKHCEVWGVEPVKELYDDARQYGYTQLFHGTVEEFLKTPGIEAERFDVIFLGDVLEHMMSPGEVLASLRALLKPEGRVVISLPNIAHYSTRWHLMTGHWDMQDSGILDRTHVRFFTLKTMKMLIESAGFTIEKVRPSSGSLERFGLNKLFGIGKRALFAWPTLFAVQFIFVARPRSL